MCRPLFVLVVQEAVQFCITAFEFSVADSVCGVRKMLPLVWSTDVAVKDAVIQAYRRLYLNPHGDSTRYTSVLSSRLKKRLNLDMIVAHDVLCACSSEPRLRP